MGARQRRYLSETTIWHVCAFKKIIFGLHPSGTQKSGFWLKMSEIYGISDISEAKKCALWVRVKKNKYPRDNTPYQNCFPLQKKFILSVSCGIKTQNVKKYPNNGQILASKIVNILPSARNLCRPRASPSYLMRPT